MPSIHRWTKSTWKDAQHHYILEKCLMLVRIVIIKMSRNNKCWRECGEKGSLLPCWWECKLVEPLWRIVSVQFSHSVVSDSLRPHELQHTRPPCPSPSPGVHSDSRPSSPWCHPAISSSVVPFFSCPQSLPASDESTLFQWVNSLHEVARVLEFQL